GGLAVPGAALDREPFTVPDHEAEVADRGNGTAALGVELGHVGELIHVRVLLSVRATLSFMPPGSRRPRAAAGRSASCRPPPRAPLRPARAPPPGRSLRW